MAEEYTDFRIRIGARQEQNGTYPLEAVLGDGSAFVGGELSLDRKALREVELDSREYGQKLHQALFVDPLDRAYAIALGKSDGRVRIRLRIDGDAAELQAIPWERLHYYDTKGAEVPLAASSETPFSRYYRLQLPEDGPLTQRPIKMLVVIANPPDLEDGFGMPAIDVATEIENLGQALGDLGRTGETVQVTLMPGQTGVTDAELRASLDEAGYRILDGPASLANIVEQMKDTHVLHLIAHGAYSRQRGEAEGERQAALFLEDDTGEKCQIIKDDEFVERLAPLSTRPRLVFLAACESAKRDDSEGSAQNPFVGLGPKLVQAGVPAVVAMQEKIPMDAARTLVRSFYRRLYEDGVVDQALNEARSSVYRPDNPDWSIPVLFMRLKTGQLLDADPVRAALLNTRDDPDYACFSPEKDIYLPLPLEVLHQTRDQAFEGPDYVRADSTARLDIITAFEMLFAQHTYLSSDADGPDPQLILLVGGAGSNRSTQLKRLVWHTAQASLEPNARRVVLPVFVDLMRYPAVRAKYEPITSLLRDALAKFWPDSTPLDLDRLLNEGPTLRVLFYGIDDLPEREQRPAWEQIQELIADYPQHEYVLATDEPYVKLHQVRIGKLELHLLVVQPLSQRKIRYLLDEMARNDPSIPMLVSKMDQAQLFDLAQTPWFLVRMIRRARAGDYPDSRTEVLQRLVEDAVAKIPAEQGMRAHAEETIYAIAWEMQSARRTTWPVSTAFETMAAVRGSREYNLEAFYKELTDTILLNRVGEDYLRFNYLPIQAYCCAKAILAMPDRDVVLDDITATLGRITRLRWWEETMVFLSGLMCDERDELKKLLHKIVYGVNILEGEQTFLAARCLLESQHAGQEDDLDLVGQVTDALIWRLNRENEPRITHRVRAARLLGQLIYPLACRTSDPDCEEPIQNKEQRDEICSAVVDNLTKVANQRARRDSSGNPDYYYSSLRLAAAMALQHLYPKLEREVEDIDPRLDEVLHLWQEKKVDELVEEVRSGNEETQAIAVLAVGDMYDQAVMGKDRKRRRLIIDCLVEVFLDPDTEQVVRWAVADALSIIDSEVVNRRVIRSILSEQAEAKFDPEQRIHLYKCLAYLIGRIRTQDGRAHRFLRETCLGEHADVRLWASAIRALGELSDPQHRPLLEQIALGEFQDVELSEACRVNLEDGLSHAYERTLLRRRAIEALSNVGDEQTLQKLRAGKTDLDLELWRSFYLTSEEIYWRMSQGLGSAR